MTSARLLSLFTGIMSMCVVLGITLAACDAEAVKKNEDYYNTKFCDEKNGVREYILADGARVDCITEEHAIEADWSYKWAEAIGQSLYYASQTGLEPGILFIYKEGRPTPCQHYERLVGALQWWGLEVEIWEINGTCKDKYLYRAA